MKNNQENILITEEGLQNLKEEYLRLTKVKRPAIVVRLSDSRQGGDLAENSEYLQAKEELAFIDGRISELEGVLERATLVAVKSGPRDKVDLGCRVTLITNGKKEQVFHLVGEWEADPTNQKISHSSPLGKLLLGRKVGEEIEFEAPAGKIIYKILKIE